MSTNHSDSLENPYQSFHWAAIVTSVIAFTSVCVYSRIGYCRWSFRLPHNQQQTGNLLRHQANHHWHDDFFVAVGVECNGNYQDI